MSDEAKRVAAEAACAHITDGMTLGLGTGSTADYAIRRIGEMCAKGMRLRGVPTSERTAKLAREVGIPLATLDEVTSIDLTIDGADEVGPGLDLIKGLGGALLREKVVASITKKQIIVVDPSKMVEKLGTRSPLPVEVLPFGVAVVKRKLDERGILAKLREKDGKPVVTDNGNLVLDASFPHGIADPRALERELNNIPGVVENGLFLGMTWLVVIGEAGGKVHEVGR